MPSMNIRSARIRRRRMAGIEPWTIEVFRGGVRHAYEGRGGGPVQAADPDRRRQG
jgi:hypothetical protein